MSTKRTIAIARNNKNGSRNVKTYSRKPQLTTSATKAKCQKRTMDQLQLSEPKKMKTMEKRPKFDKPAENHVHPREYNATLRRSNERKIINEWIQGALNNNVEVNVNELVQDASLFNLSDINNITLRKVLKTSETFQEDDAFQLAKYLESSDQTIQASVNINSVNPASFSTRQTVPDENSLECSINRWDETIVSEMNFEQLNDLSSKQSTPNKCFDKNISTLDVSSPRSHDNVTHSDSTLYENANWKHEEKIIIDIADGQNIQVLVSEIYQEVPEFSEKNSTDMSKKASSEQSFTNDNTKLELDDSNEISDGMELEIVSTSPPVTQAVSIKEIQKLPNIRHVPTSSVAGNIASVNAGKYVGGSYTRITRNNALKQQMTNLFNRPCYNYINGKNCGKYMCKWNHYLPAAHDVFQKMIRFSNDTIMYMYYNFLVKTEKVFATYFPTICDIFGNKKMEKSLLNAIKDCEQCDKIPFIKHIFTGLVMTGMSKHDALTSIADYCTKSRAINDLFLEIIIETDPLYFVDMLKSYYRYATITPHHLKKLLQQVIDTPAPLLDVFIDILDQYSMYHVCDVETFKSVVSTAKSLVDEDVNLSQRLNNLASRVP